MEFFEREEVGDFLNGVPGLLAWIMPLGVDFFQGTVWVSEPPPVGSTELDGRYPTREEAAGAILDRLAEVQWSSPGVF